MCAARTPYVATRGAPYAASTPEVFPSCGIFPELFLNTVMSRPDKRVFEFGPFLLDPAEHTLRRDGKPVPLRPKVFDMLVVLVERHGHLVEKNELMQAVWPEQIIEEGNLNKNVSMLRLALGEGRGGSKYIETVPKRGYRFKADVRRVGGNGNSELVVETRTHASLVVEAETGDEVSMADDTTPAADAVVVRPTTEEEAPSARPAGESARRSKSKRAHALPYSVAAAAVIIALAAAYIYYPTGGEEAIDSVAVLPFVNEGGDPEAEYLSDGMADSTINSLTRLPDLRVISLSTVMRYKGQQVDPQQVGRELNVRAVLVGRVTQRGDALAISTELVDVRDNRRLWGGQYNGKPSDILAVQEEIAGEIAEKLRLRLGGAEKQRQTKHNTESTEAYDAYLRGRFMLEKRTGPATEKSIEYLEQSVKLDPDYALAYADLGYAYFSLGALSARSPNEVLPKAKETVTKALEIDNTLAEAHTALGQIRLTDWDWPGAERAFKRAIELNPSSGYAHAHYAQFFRVMNRFDEAIAESKRAVELEPVSIVFNRNVAFHLYHARRYDEVIEQCQKTLELDPNMSSVYGWLAVAYERKGLYDQSLSTGQKFDNPTQGNTFSFA